MNRREMLKTIGLSTFAMSLLKTDSIYANDKRSFKEPIKPKPLTKGDTVAIVAPGTNAPESENYIKAQEIIQWLDLNPIYSDLLKKGDGYKTRNPELKANEINSFFKNDDIKAIFCIRGGYGSQQILDLLDYEAIQKNPKIFTGYSDITAIHMAISKFSGLVTFHCPVMNSAFTSFTAKYFKELLFNEAIYPYRMNNPESNSIRNPFPIYTINSGEVEGKLIGGNLSIIISLMGTKYEIDTDDKILFLEDVGEAPYRIDRMLGQLKMAGKLDNIRGLVFGKCEECTGGEAGVWDLSLFDVFNYYIKPLGIPAFYGILLGHSQNQITIPENIHVKISADNGWIELLENPLSI